MTLLLLFLVGAVMGCGGGGDATGSSGSTKQEKVDWSMYPPGPTRQFIVPGKDNAVQTFGWEATAAERAQVTKEIAEWMRLRSAGNLQKFCTYLSHEYTHYIVFDAHADSKNHVKTCPGAIRFIESKVRGKASKGHRNTFGDGPVVSFRINETHGYAQYHGNDGRDWVVPMAKEDGEWKISNATPIERLK